MEKTVLFILGLLAAALLVYVMVFAIRLPYIKRELRYVNMELKRADEDEKKYWQCCKKRLVLAALFFLRY